MHIYGTIHVKYSYIIHRLFITIHKDKIFSFQSIHLLIPNTKQKN